MSITKRSIYRLAITNLIVIGLIGCSSTPAPWTQQDASWESDNETSQNNSSLNADDKPQSDAGLQASTAVVVTDTVDKDTATDNIMEMMSTNYAVQVYAANSVNSVEKFKNDKHIADLMTVKTKRSGSVVYVLVDIYPDRATANAAAAELEIKTGSKPWVRSLAGLQKIAVP